MTFAQFIFTAVMILMPATIISVCIGWLAAELWFFAKDTVTRIRETRARRAALRYVDTFNLCRDHGHSLISSHRAATTAQRSTK